MTRNYWTKSLLVQTWTSSSTNASSKYRREVFSVVVIPPHAIACACGYFFLTIVHRKTERKISFAEFKNAIKELASIKYPGDPSGVDKMEKLLTSGSGAKTNKATVTHFDLNDIL